MVVLVSDSRVLLDGGAGAGAGRARTSSVVPVVWCRGNSCSKPKHHAFRKIPLKKQKNKNKKKGKIILKPKGAIMVII
jgi:hypothetical protein